MATILVHPRTARDRHLIKNLQERTQSVALLRNRGRVVELVSAKRWANQVRDLINPEEPGPSAA